MLVIGLLRHSDTLVPRNDGKLNMVFTLFSREFDRQVNNLLQKKYPEAAGMSADSFKKLLEPLSEKIKSVPEVEIDFETGTLPFVIVIKSEIVDAEKAMQKVERLGKNGITKLFPHVPKDFNIIESITIPKEPAYLLTGIDRGKKYLNVRPQDAFIAIQKEGRSPITIDEGIAIITHFPDFLMKNNCFSLLASRVPGNQRVPAIWINSAKHPNLGWCWDGNPHTWLGSASCLNRK